MKKISSRLSSLPLSEALRIDLEAKRLTKEGKSIINFCVGEPDFATPPHILEKASAFLSEGQIKYTNASGSPRMKQAVSDYYKRVYGLEYGPEEIAVTPGGKYAVYAAVSALCDPMDTVLLPAPYWTSYYHIITLSGAKVNVIRSSEEASWKITPELLEFSITPETKAIILNNPSNPSGAVYTKEELTALYRVIRKYDLYVISDEIYDRLVYQDGLFTSFAELSEDAKERTLIINGVSKAFSMTGFRIGYVLGSRNIIRAVSSFLSHTTGCPSAVSQEAAIEALDTETDSVPRMCLKYRERRDFLISSLSGLSNISFTKPDGAFYLMLSPKGRLSEKYPTGEAFSYALLTEAGVATVPCRDYGIPEAVRISFSVSDSELYEGIKRITGFLNSL